MKFEFNVSVEVERTKGKFASKDELMEKIGEWIESCNEVQVECDNGGMYDVIDWAVDPA